MLCEWWGEDLVRFIFSRWQNCEIATVSDDFNLLFTFASILIGRLGSAKGVSNEEILVFNTLKDVRGKIFQSIDFFKSFTAVR